MFCTLGLGYKRNQSEASNWAWSPSLSWHAKIILNRGKANTKKKKKKKKKIASILHMIEYLFFFVIFL